MNSTIMRYVSDDGNDPIDDLKAEGKVLLTAADKMQTLKSTGAVIESKNDLLELHQITSDTKIL